MFISLFRSYKCVNTTSSCLTIFVIVTTSCIYKVHSCQSIYMLRHHMTLYYITAFSQKKNTSTFFLLFLSGARWQNCMSWVWGGSLMNTNMTHVTRDMVWPMCVMMNPKLWMSNWVQPLQPLIRLCHLNRMILGEFARNSSHCPDKVRSSEESLAVEEKSPANTYFNRILIPSEFSRKANVLLVPSSILNLQNWIIRSQVAFQILLKLCHLSPNNMHPTLHKWE